MEWTGLLWTGHSSHGVVHMDMDSWTAVDVTWTTVHVGVLVWTGEKSPQQSEKNPRRVHSGVSNVNSMLNCLKCLDFDLVYYTCEDFLWLEQLMIPDCQVPLIHLFLQFYLTEDCSLWSLFMFVYFFVFFSFIIAKNSSRFLLKISSTS